MRTLTHLAPPSYNPYYLLRVYAYYRALLGSVLLLMFQGGIAANVLGSVHKELFFYTSSIYTVINVVTLSLLWRTRFLPSQKYLFTLLLIDLIAISLLMYSSGGVANGLGYLILIAVAAGGILLHGQVAILFAALACIAVVSESLYRFIVGRLESNTLFSAASLGILIFIIAIAFQYLTKKILASTLEAQTQALNAAHLQKLAQQIVERMRTGILVFNKNHDISLANQAAMDLLGLSESNHKLQDIPALERKVHQWQASRHYSPIMKLEGSTNEIKINFSPLDTGDDADILVFVEDNHAITQQAQQLKLASLGRLTASIAHEIRNPLGAISHASQLLSEAETLNPNDQRLLEIINTHCKRVNQIIENVLQLSRRRTSEPQQINLNNWLKNFVADYQNSKSEPVEIVLHSLTSPIIGPFDPGQLQQVLTNLCDNGLRYSAMATGKARIIIVSGVDTKQQRPFINIIDEGPGIKSEDLNHIFEPFFTTENTGSGLGLFICKELCEANHAVISYHRTPDGNSCFNIQLTHPERAL